MYEQQVWSCHRGYKSTGVMISRLSARCGIWAVEEEWAGAVGVRTCPDEQRDSRA